MLLCKVFYFYKTCCSTISSKFHPIAQNDVVKAVKIGNFLPKEGWSRVS